LATTRRLLQSDAHIRDLGEHRLKDLVDAERLFQLGDGEFPPLRTLDATNLPIVSIPLVDRLTGQVKGVRPSPLRPSRRSSAPSRS
jgi:hypothetical protein